MQLTPTSIARRTLSKHGIKHEPYPVPDDVVDYLESQMIIPETGKPLVLQDEQKRVLREMTRRENGSFVYSTMLFSMPKKSGKTTIGAGVALWQAERIPDGRIYIVGNDLKQADNRMQEAIRYCVKHNPRLRKSARITRNNVHLANGTIIEAVPIDAAGEAGSNPTGIFWTEAWGAKQRKHEDMWTEMVLSPTRAGQAFKFVESYAGHSGESTILERLYESLVKPEYALPQSPELYAVGNSVAYWCTRRYLPWQVDAVEYYEQEAREKTPEEYERQHHNRWVTSKGAFIQPEWWSACKGILPPLGQYDSIIVGIDAAVSGDCFAVVGVSRQEQQLYVRFCRVWTPDGDKLDYPQIKREIEELFSHYYVAAAVYDEYQMHLMAQELMTQLQVWFDPFSQGHDRLVADKQLRDLIVNRQIMHDGTHDDLTEHLLNAAGEVDKSEKRMRIVKKNAHAKIDAAVALSMATARALELNIG